MPVQQIIADNNRIPLAGSLWLPVDRPRALLLMHPGSGPSDRDNDVLFPPIRSALLDAGIAVCSFDKRGVGGSGGSWLTADIPTQATDLAVSLAAVQDRLPSLPTGLFGHSQGGWVVLEAARATNAAFVVTNSGPAVSPRVQEEFSTGNGLARLQVPAATATDAASLFSELMDRIGRGESFEVVAGWLADPVRSAARTALIDAGAFVPDDGTLWTFAASILDHDPLPVLEQFSVPLLALFGGEDTVVPVSASVGRLRTAVPESLLTVRVLPGGDHRLQTADEQFVPGYLDELVGFVSAAAG